MSKRLALIAAIGILCLTLFAHAGMVEIKNNQLYVDGVAQPQLFGAEVQYFRLRGGPDRNVPRARVLELWNKALDRVVEAKMNAISFYIPWDFHEYAPGQFDFDGTVDEDGDGKPDYPSRDVKTWFKLVAEHGIKNIMVRPGPYINAEWGFLGFGAVPLWFHEKYPQSHALNPFGQRTPVYSYHSPEFLSASKNWLETVYHQVIQPYVGPGKPVSFVQLDNETNYQWSSIYRHDYGPRAVARYQAFLNAEYGTLAAVNAAHHRTWASFAEIKAPFEPGLNLGEDQDWYRFQDETIHAYLGDIRKIWEDMGVHEPMVLFTLAESFNAADNGLLPNTRFRNDPGHTGMITVNLYPKTSSWPTNPLLNQPFKADHDVKSADSANDFYLGHKEEWTMGPEIQGGWWRGTDVSLDSRQQTYLSVIGHGLKAMFVYYFNEGENWDHDWAKKQVVPLFEKLHLDPRYKELPSDQLPDAFWLELNRIVADQLFSGWDAKWLVYGEGTQPPSLYFDAALDGNADPKPPFQLLKSVGEKIIEPYGRFLATSVEATDPVCFIKDAESNVASPVPGRNSLQMNADWAAGLIGYLEQAGVNPRILHWGLTPESEYASCQLFLYQDNGFATANFVQFFRAQIARGASFVNFLYDGAFNSLRDGQPATCMALPDTPIRLNGTACTMGAAHLYQVGEAIYAAFNSDSYGTMMDVPERRSFIEAVLRDVAITPTFQVRGGGDRLAVFGRRSPDSRKAWVTLKSGQTSAINARVIWNKAVPTQSYSVSRLMDGSITIYLGQDLIDKGFIAGLAPNGSDAFVIEPIQVKPQPPPGSLPENLAKASNRQTPRQTSR